MKNINQTPYEKDIATTNSMSFRAKLSYEQYLHFLTTIYKYNRREHTLFQDYFKRREQAK